MGEMLKIGDVVCLKSELDNISTKMTVEAVYSTWKCENGYRIINPDSSIREDVEPNTIIKYKNVLEYDVDVVYFNGGALIREQVKHGALSKVSG